ncbi:MAG: CoA-binding protein [Candidatus Omnitrophica bacterium]|nr:CoA-binding protein [Candidatus Omnitrophota bacterium]
MEGIKDKEIAVVGVSGKEYKFGFKIFRDLLKYGFKVSGINPRGGEVLGQKIYRTLKELKNTPELVITVVSPEITERVVEDCKELGIKEIWMQPGSESDLAIRKAKEYGIKVIYNSCFMLENKIW